MGSPAQNYLACGNWGSAGFLPVYRITSSAIDIMAQPSGLVSGDSYSYGAAFSPDGNLLCRSDSLGSPIRKISLFEVTYPAGQIATFGAEFPVDSVAIDLPGVPDWSPQGDFLVVPVTSSASNQGFWKFTRSQISFQFYASGTVTVADSIGQVRTNKFFGYSNTAVSSGTQGTFIKLLGVWP